MIRITLVSHTEEEVVLKVEGWLSGEDVSLLETEGERYFKQVKRLVLDLGEVQFIDDDGIRLLQRWSGKRLVLRAASRSGVSQFVQALLESHGLYMERG